MKKLVSLFLSAALSLLVVPVIHAPKLYEMYVYQ